MTEYKTYYHLLISDEVLFDSANLGPLIQQQHDQIFFDMAEALGLLNRATMNDPEPQFLLDWREDRQKLLDYLNEGIEYVLQRSSERSGQDYDASTFRHDQTFDESHFREMYLFLWKLAKKNPEMQAEWEDWQKRKERLDEENDAAYEKAEKDGDWYDDTIWSNRHLDLSEELEGWISDAKDKGKAYYRDFGNYILNAPVFKPGAKEFLDILLASRKTDNQLSIQIFAKHSFGVSNVIEALHAYFHTAFGNGQVNPRAIIQNCHAPNVRAVRCEDDMFVFSGEEIDTHNDGWKSWRKSRRLYPGRQRDHRLKGVAREIRERFRAIDAEFLEEYNNATPERQKELRALKRKAKHGEITIKTALMFAREKKRAHDEFVGLRDITVVCEDAALCAAFEAAPRWESDKLTIIHCVPGADKASVPAETVTDLPALLARLGIKVTPEELRDSLARRAKAAEPSFDYF